MQVVVGPPAPAHEKAHQDPQRQAHRQAEEDPGSADSERPMQRHSLLAEYVYLVTGMMMMFLARRRLNTTTHQSAESSGDVLRGRDDVGP